MTKRQRDDLATHPPPGLSEYPDGTYDTLEEMAAAVRRCEAALRSQIDDSVVRLVRQTEVTARVALHADDPVQVSRQRAHVGKNRLRTSHRRVERAA